MANTSGVSGSAPIQQTKTQKLSNGVSAADYQQEGRRTAWSDIGPNLDKAGKNFVDGKPVGFLRHLGDAFDALVSVPTGVVLEGAGKLTGDKKLAEYGERKWSGADKSGVLQDTGEAVGKAAQKTVKFLKDHAAKPDADWAQKALNNGG